MGRPRRGTEEEGRDHGAILRGDIHVSRLRDPRAAPRSPALALRCAALRGQRSREGSPEPPRYGGQDAVGPERRSTRVRGGLVPQVTLGGPGVVKTRLPDRRRLGRGVRAGEWRVGDCVVGTAALWRSRGCDRGGAHAGRHGQAEAGREGGSVHRRERAVAEVPGGVPWETEARVGAGVERRVLVHRSVRHAVRHLGDTGHTG